MARNGDDTPVLQLLRGADCLVAWIFLLFSTLLNDFVYEAELKRFLMMVTDHTEKGMEVVQ